MTGDEPPSYEESLEQSRRISVTTNQHQRTIPWDNCSEAPSNYSVNTYRDDSYCSKLYFPKLPMLAAIFCLILNIIIPGSGTLLVAVCLCCLTKDFTLKEKFLGFFTNVLIGILQISLVPLLCIGWIWSILWGAGIITASKADEVVDVSNPPIVGIEDTQSVRHRTISTISQNYVTHEGFVYPLPPPKYDDIYNRTSNRASTGIPRSALSNNRVGVTRTTPNCTSITPIEDVEQPSLTAMPYNDQRSERGDGHILIRS